MNWRTEEMNAVNFFLFLCAWFAQRERERSTGPVTVFPIPDDFKCVLCKLEKKVWFCVAPIDR